MDKVNELINKLINELINQDEKLKMDLNKKSKFKFYVNNAMIGIQQFAKILNFKPSEFKIELLKIVTAYTKDLITDEEYEERKKEMKEEKNG